MAAKKKTVTKDDLSSEAVAEEKEEEVIEVKTGKTTDPSEEKTEPKAETKAKISSFSQLDASDIKADTAAETENAQSDKPDVDEKEQDTESVSSDDTNEEEETDGPKKSTEVSSGEAKNWLKSASPEIEAEDAPKGSKLKILVVILIIAAILGLIAGGFYYYQSKVKPQPEEKTAEPTPAETVVTPTPTPQEVMEEIDMSKYSVSILNGSGVPGEAGNVEDLLSDLEFGDFAKGNAESYDYETTEVSIKDGLSESIYEQIATALESEYDVSLSKTKLDTDSAYDIIIIVGTRK